MAFRFRSNQSVEGNLKRIAKEQLDTALAEITDSEIERAEVVHQVRKRCKKLRGLLRLVKPSFPAFRKENGFFRDAAKKLSIARDSEAVMEAFEKLINSRKSKLSKKKAKRIREWLRSRQADAACSDAELESRLQNFAHGVEPALKRISKWKVERRGWKAIGNGFTENYARGRQALSAAKEDRCIERRHEWRKYVKYHWYHLRLLRDLWRGMLEARAEETKYLGELLGDEHDLSVLDQLAADADQVTPACGELRAIIRKRQKELRRQAFAVGPRLFAETPNSFEKRFRRYWEAR